MNTFLPTLEAESPQLELSSPIGLTKPDATPTRDRASSCDRKGHRTWRSVSHTADRQTASPLYACADAAPGRARRGSACRSAHMRAAARLNACARAPLGTTCV